ncbi:MAG: SURF1 family protein [Sulfuritalea sp.]|nr:SURF1 family protein [Sulfuritalea sp.]
MPTIPVRCLAVRRPSRALLQRASISLVLVAVCLGMAWLQLWRAETRGGNFERQQAGAGAAPIALGADQRDAEFLQWRPVTARGVWLAERTVFLDNKIHRQRVGYHVLTPLQLDGSRAVVLVNRGWVPAPRLRSEMPLIATAAGSVEIIGIARKFESKFFEFGNPQPEGPVWQHVREDDYRQRSGLDALPVTVLQSDAAADGLIRDWSDLQGPANPAPRHYAYAIMWGVFALMAAGYGLLAWKRQ